MEIGVVPPTPNHNLLDAQVTVPTAYATIVLEGSKLGHPVAYAQEQSGVLVQNLLPIRMTEDQQISSSSKTNLELHTETAFHPYKPDYLLLLCLRHDDSAATTYSNSEDFLSELTDRDLEVLQRRAFVTQVDDSFKTDGSETADVTLPVLTSDSLGGYTVAYDKYAMRGASEEEQIALDRLTDAIERTMRSVTLQTADLLVIDNSSVVHGRSSFVPRYDGTDRWLLRLMIVKSLPPSEHLSGRMITTSFSKPR